jgi:putative salt-induced outer membrane protein YdiY
MSRTSKIPALLAGVLVVSAPLVWAQDSEEELGWELTGEVSFVTTGGNAEAETLGLGLTAVHTRENDELSFAAGGLRAESTTVNRFAIGTPDDFQVVEDSETDLTAEHFYLRGRYQQDFGEQTFWFAGLGWERNELAGFTRRVSAVGGLGRQWYDSERGHFRTDAGLTFTTQEDVVEVAGGSDDFLGLRLSYDYGRQLTETTDFSSVLIIDENLDESEDLRANFLNSLSVSINELLSLKLSLHLFYDNLPSLAAVTLFDPTGREIGSVRTELDELDTVFSVAVVFTR